MKDNTMASCNECSAPLPPSRKVTCARCERVARLKKASEAGDQIPQHSVHSSDAESVVPPTTEKTTQSDNTVETNKPSVTPSVQGGNAHSKIKVFHCPACNMPLIPGDTSCLKCGKQFSKPTPKITEPRLAEPSSLPLPVVLRPAPLRNVSNPRSKIIVGTFLVLACFTALVVFVITQSQANNTQAILAEQAHQQELQDQAQLQQAPVPVAMPAPVVMNVPPPPQYDADASATNTVNPSTAETSSPDGNNTQTSVPLDNPSVSDSQQRQQSTDGSQQFMADEQKRRRITSLEIQIEDLRKQQETDQGSIDSTTADKNPDAYRAFTERRDARTHQISALLDELNSIPGAGYHT